MAIDYRKFDQENVRAWMQLHYEEFIDPTTGEVCCTSLAEEAAHQFGRSGPKGPLDDETHWIWDLPLEFV